MTGDVDQPGHGLRIVFMGTPESAAGALEAVLAAGFSVPLAVTRPDRARGRGGRVSPSPLKLAAEAAGIPLLQPENVNAADALERIRQTRLDVLLVVAYGKILTRAVLDAPRILPLNLHFSLLPEYRGAAPVVHAIADGKTETGVSVQRIVRKLDAGPIIAAERCAIGPEETARELMERLTGIGSRLTVKTLRRVEAGDWEETPQDGDRATLAPMLKKSDGRVHWEDSAKRIHCHVRAMDPWPGATTIYRSRARDGAVRVTVMRCARAGGVDAGCRPGEVVGADKRGILVQTGAGGLLITSLKPSGKRTLSAAEFRNGYRTAPGDRFGGE